MSEFKQCRECTKQHMSRQCPYQELHREVKMYIRDEARKNGGNYDCKAFNQKPPPPPPMTSEEYGAKQNELLKDIPEEFHSALCSMAYESGHSAGMEECISHLSGLISDLKPSIEKYTKRLTQQHSLV